MTHPSRHLFSQLGVKLTFFHTPHPVTANNQSVRFHFIFSSIFLKREPAWKLQRPYAAEERKVHGVQLRNPHTHCWRLKRGWMAVSIYSGFYLLFAFLEWLWVQRVFISSTWVITNKKKNVLLNKKQIEIQKLLTCFIPWQLGIRLLLFQCFCLSYFQWMKVVGFLNWLNTLLQIYSIIIKHISSNTIVKIESMT